MFDKVPSVTGKAMDGVGVINRGGFKNLISRFKSFFFFTDSLNPVLTPWLV